MAAVFLVAACSAAVESAGEEPVPAADPGVTAAPTTLVDAMPAPTTTTEPPQRAIQIAAGGVQSELAPQVLEEIDARVEGFHWTSAPDWCDPDAAVLALPAGEALPADCERFDRTAALSATSITGVWTSTPTACLTVEVLVEILTARPHKGAFIETLPVDHLDATVASLDLDLDSDNRLKAGVTWFADPPTAAELDASPARFLLAPPGVIDAHAEGLWEVLIDGGAGCAAPTPAEVVAGRYPLGTHWHVLTAGDAPRELRVAIDELRPALAEAQAPPAPVDPRYERPAWLGTPLTELRGGSNYGVAQPTPPELQDRQLATVDIFPSPRGDEFHFTIGAVPAEVVTRSTWSPACPVTLADLRYVTMSFWGFDQRPHIGEMIVNEQIAEQTVEIFRELYEMRYPIEDMSVMPTEFWTNPPTGDDNITSSFECRAAVGGSGGWSNHAFGLAIDINPFHNVYRKGSLILPEYAEAYLDRTDVRSGMIVEGDPVVALFDEIGWGWGGRWSSADDPMHFSWNGR